MSISIMQWIRTRRNSTLRFDRISCLRAVSAVVGGRRLPGTAGMGAADSAEQR
jgi:hypothetical protein